MRVATGEAMEVKVHDPTNRLGRLDRPKEIAPSSRSGSTTKCPASKNYKLKDDFVLLDHASTIAGPFGSTISRFRFSLAILTFWIFRPIEPGKISMYVCGIAACDLSHLDHACAAINSDVVFSTMVAPQMDIYHSMGDTLAQQYGGYAAHNTGIAEMEKLTYTTFLMLTADQLS
ncbi:hypothetical protein TB1_024255 [Malus domestica]